MYSSRLFISAILAFAFAATAAPTPNPVFGRSAFSDGLLSRGALRRDSPSVAASRRSEDAAIYPRQVILKRIDLESHLSPLPILEVNTGVETGKAADLLLAPDAVDAIELRAHHSRDMFHLH